MKRIVFSLIVLASLLMSISAELSAQTTKSSKGKTKTEQSSKKKSAPVDSLKNVDLDAVTVTATRLFFVSKKDTVIYNLDALSLSQGDLLGDALEKFPGMEIKSGKLFYQGKAVNRLLINGIDFAKNDTSKALKALPAYIVNKVKTYKQQTENARLTGFDNGERDIVVDVMLRKKYLGSWTGEGQVKGGYKNLYLAQGYANTFTDSYRVSLFGNSNNINDQRWYAGDGNSSQGFKGRNGGRYTFHSPGATFFWKNSKERGKKGYFIVEGDGDYNIENSFNQERLEREKYLDGANLFSDERSERLYKHRRLAMHLNLEWNPTDNTVLLYKPTLELSTYKNTDKTLSGSWNSNPFVEKKSLLDSLQFNPKQWATFASPQNLIQDEVLRNGDITHYLHKLMTRHSFSKNSSLTAEHNIRYEYDKGNANAITAYRYFNQSGQNQLMNRYFDRHHSKTYSNTLLQYRHLLGDFSFSLGYNYYFNKKDSHELGYRLDDLGSIFADMSQAFTQVGVLPANFDKVSNALLEDETSRIELDINHKHKFDPEFSYRKNGFYLSISPELVYMIDQYDFKKGRLQADNLKRNYLVYYLDVNLNYNNDGAYLFCFYNISTEKHHLRNAITSPDLSNPLFVRLSNPNLKDQLSQTFYFNAYKRFNFKIKGQDFNPTISYNNSLNFIQNGLTSKFAYDTKTGISTTMPVNTNASFQMYQMLNLQTPLELKQRLLLDLSTSFNIDQRDHYALAGRLEDVQANQMFRTSGMVSIGPMLRLSKFNMKLSYAYFFDDYKNSSPNIKDVSNNSYGIKANMSWKLPYDIHFKADVNYLNRNGYESQVFQKHRTLINFELEQSFLKDKSLAVYLTGRDLLNQDNGFYQGFGPSVMTRSYRNTLGRHILLGVKYRFSYKNN